MSIKLSISGIRGQFHELTPNRVTQFAQAFSTYIGRGSVIIGSDARPSGKFIREALIAGLTSSGSQVLDYGILPTPILQWILKNSSYSGGVSITAGHNTFDWNCLIFLSADGSYLNHLEGLEFFNIYHSGNFTKKSFDKLGKYSMYSPHREFIDSYFQSLQLKTEPRKPWKFVLDCSNGFGPEIVEQLSRSLKVKMIPIFCGKDGFTAKDPEPTIRNANLLGTIVRETDSSGGFLLNSDASRVLVVDETGLPLSEELTLPIFSMILLEEHKSDIVTNYSTSRSVDQVAKKFGVRVFRTDVGQPFVVQSVKNTKAFIGGEGSGSVVYSPFSLGFDSFIFIKKMVEYLDKKNLSVSDISHRFSTPDIYKETIHFPPDKIYSLLEKIGDLFQEDKIRLKDGFYIDFGEEWLCIRASATVSMVRVIGEGSSIAHRIARIKEMVE